MHQLAQVTLGLARALTVTGGKGENTQQVHWEFIEGSETNRLPFTQQVRGGYFSKVPTGVPTRYFQKEPSEYFLKVSTKVPISIFLKEPTGFFENFFQKVPTMYLGHSSGVLLKSAHQFNQNVPNHILSGFFESLWEN